MLVLIFLFLTFRYNSPGFLESVEREDIRDEFDEESEHGDEVAVEHRFESKKRNRRQQYEPSTSRSPEETAISPIQQQQKTPSSRFIDIRIIEFIRHNSNSLNSRSPSPSSRSDSRSKKTKSRSRSPSSSSENSSRSSSTRSSSRRDNDRRKARSPTSARTYSSTTFDSTDSIFIFHLLIIEICWEWVYRRMAVMHSIKLIFRPP